MIKVTDENIELKGELTTVLVELSVITDAVVNLLTKKDIERERACDIVLKACEAGTLLPDELWEKTKELVAREKELLNILE